MATSKPRVLKDFEKLETAIQEQIKLSYPSGFYQHLVSFVDREGNKRMALPYETEDKYYLVRMSIQEAKDMIEDDDDYDDDGMLKDDIQENYADKHGDDFDDVDDEEEDEKPSKKKQDEEDEDEDDE
jgi:hypothetical protein